MSINPWSNFISVEQMTESRLKELDLSYFPKIIMSAKKGSFTNTIKFERPFSGLSVSIGQTLTAKEIEDFSEFTIETFYKLHSSHYPISEVSVFKSHQALFFSRPYHYVRHEIDSKIVGYLVVGMLEEHPFFQEPTWHIGYWGISRSIRDKSVRDAIKYDWGTTLQNLNQDTRVAGNIDYFNKPAFQMASNFGMKTHGYRLDPRE